MKKRFFIPIFFWMLWVGLIYTFSGKEENNINQSVLSKNTSQRLYNPNNCEIKSEPFVIQWRSMVPLIQPNQEVEVSLNYYNCSQNVPKTWEVIIFENPFTKERVIKKIWFSQWDTVIIDTKSNTLQVNGTTFMNSEKKEYIFTPDELKMFQIYIQNKKVSKDVYFIFWDNINGSTDSRSYGPITWEWILGKVIQY